FVGTCRDHPPAAGGGADDDGLSGKGGVVPLFHRGVKSVQVHVKYDGPQRVAAHVFTPRLRTTFTRVLSRVSALAPTTVSISGASNSAVKVSVKTPSEGRVSCSGSGFGGNVPMSSRYWRGVSLMGGYELSKRMKSSSEVSVTTTLRGLAGICTRSWTLRCWRNSLES